jgi:hypothetical protein
MFGWAAFHEIGLNVQGDGGFGRMTGGSRGQKTAKAEEDDEKPSAMSAASSHQLATFG